MKKTPVTTLFMLMSLDGKISPGSSDMLDVDTDFPNIKGVREGLYQYYEMEKSTDLWSLNSGRVQQKIGVNQMPLPEKTPVSFVLIDNRHLSEQGIRYFCARSKEFVLVTTNPAHLAFSLTSDNMHIVLQDRLDLKEMLKILKSDYGCERITIQSGGTLNGLFLREKLLDYVNIVVAPVLIGGSATATLIDGQSIISKEELGKIGILQLEECNVLQESYLQLKYKVI